LEILKTVRNNTNNTVRFADDTVTIAETQEELQDMVNILVVTGKEYRMKVLSSNRK
jgi:Reverse transcriptase (RNA-dependent DNA polymerase).